MAEMPQRLQRDSIILNFEMIANRLFQTPGVKHVTSIISKS